MSRLHAIALTLSIVLPLASPHMANAQVKVTEDRVDWYDVRGKTVAELRRSLTRNTTAGEFDAEAKWWVDWRFRWNGNGKECRLTSDHVSFRAVVTFPRLSTRQGMPAQLQKSWDNYSRKLMAHERQHIRHGAEAAREIDLLFDNFAVPGDCRNMEEKANAAAMEIIRKANSRDRNYDKSTDHGRHEGAVLK